MTQPQSKVLAEATVKRSGNRVLLESKHGMIEVNKESTKLMYGDTFDAKNGESLLYSAYYGGGKYNATSVCRPKDLIEFTATLTNINFEKKFGHAEVVGKRRMKIFVPFCCNLNGGRWYGNGLTLNKQYKFKTFAQVPAFDCGHVAWSVHELSHGLSNLPPQSRELPSASTMKKLGTPPNVVQRHSDHQSVQQVRGQFGVIFNVIDRCVSVVSPTAQQTTFPADQFEDWMVPGRCLQFDGTRVSDDKLVKLLGSNPKDLGSYYPYIYESQIPLKPKTLTIFVTAVLNRIVNGISAFAWNDHVGRIYIPWKNMEKNMTESRLTPFTAVSLGIYYTGKHDDVPWTTSYASLCSDEESPKCIAESAQMLRTEDGWKVENVGEGIENSSVFLAKYDENEKTSAFAQIIDVNCTEKLQTGTLVRVTYYYQERHQKHSRRAVLVTPLDKNDKPTRNHRVHIGSRCKRVPDLFEQPTVQEMVVEAPVPQKPKPPSNCWNLAMLDAPIKTTPSSHLTRGFPSVFGEASRNAEAETAIPLVVQYEQFPSFSEEQNRVRVPVWAGTPAEFKPESYFQPTTNNYVSHSSAQSTSSCVSEDQNVANGFGLSQNPGNTMPHNGNGLRHTQSEASSPGLKTDIEPNSWTFAGTAFGGSFQYGVAAPLDVPIFQRLAPTVDAFPRPVGFCCDSNKILIELLKNPNFVNSLSATDPQTLQLLTQKLHLTPFNCAC